MGDLAAAVRAGEKTAVARALNLVEDQRPRARAAVAELLVALRGAGGHRVGLTGPPGVGKSTLAAALARALRDSRRTVGVLAIDPSSARSGGSLLGDRARMGFDPADEGLFVRSLATGGDRGGLSSAALAAVDVLAAAYEVVLVETTGVGQSETDVRLVTDTVALVVQPGGGDVLQFLKAGVMEIPDVLVVNKADHEALAQRTAAELQGALQTMVAVGAGEALPLVRASATTGEGVAELLEALDAHRSAIAAELGARRHAGEVAWTLRLFRRLHGDHGVRVLGGEEALRRWADEALAHAAPPRACETLSERYLATLCPDAGPSHGPGPAPLPPHDDTETSTP